MKNRLLMIDDDMDLAEEFITIFRANGFIVCHAGDGLTGKRELISDRYDILILDIRMPGCDGIEILEWIRDSGIKIEIIILSGMPSVQLWAEGNGKPEKADNAGLFELAFTVLDKPTHPDVLLRILKEIAE
ncbi:MAG: response regulator [Spirochaetales bacterium]|nr:response regulator [Spirochaetales bacterium]